MYHLKQPGIGYAIENYGAMCLDWYHLVEEEQTNPFMFIECPCSIQLLRWDPWFSSRLRTVTSDTECYDSWSWWINYPNTMVCKDICFVFCADCSFVLLEVTCH